MQEVREAIAKLGNIAQKYMSTNAEEFVHIVIGEPEAEACGPRQMRIASFEKNA